MDVDCDGLVRTPPFSRQCHCIAGRVVRLVAAQRGVEERLGGGERGLSAAEPAGGEHGAGMRDIEEVGGEELPRGGRRFDCAERASDRIVDLGGRDGLSAVRAAGDQDTPVVKQLYAEVTAASGAHLRGHEREGIPDGIVNLGRIEVPVRRALAASDEDRAVEQQRRAGECATDAESARCGNRAAAWVVQFRSPQCSGRVGASCDQNDSLRQSRGSVVLPRRRERTGRP